MLTYNWTHIMQLANTPPLQSTTWGLHPLSIHQTLPLLRGSKHPITAYYTIYRPRNDEWLSWSSWLTCSGRFTHISGHPSAAGWALDGKFAGQRPTFYHCANFCLRDTNVLFSTGHKNTVQQFIMKWYCTIHQLVQRISLRYDVLVIWTYVQTSSLQVLSAAWSDEMMWFMQKDNRT